MTRKHRVATSEFARACLLACVYSCLYLCVCHTVCALGHAFAQVLARDHSFLSISTEPRGRNKSRSKRAIGVARAAMFSRAHTHKHPKIPVIDHVHTQTQPHTHTHTHTHTPCAPTMSVRVLGFQSRTHCAAFFNLARKIGECKSENMPNYKTSPTSILPPKRFISCYNPTSPLR